MKHRTPDIHKKHEQKDNAKGVNIPDFKLRTREQKHHGVGTNTDIHVDMEQEEHI